MQTLQKTAFVEVLLKVTRSAVRIKLHIYSQFYFVQLRAVLGHDFVHLILFQFFEVFNLTDTI